MMRKPTISLNQIASPVAWSKLVPENCVRKTTDMACWNGCVFPYKTMANKVVRLVIARDERGEFHADVMGTI